MVHSRELTLGTAGHIDHGKTALVRALTGIDTDRLEQEKQRGISIDIGFAFLDLGDRRLGIVDVPGHERFIKNMLAGASGIDMALLVIAADDSIMPQTREHLAILRLLGVEQGVVAVTKADVADPDWIELVKDDVRGLTAGSFLEDAPIVVTSATTGEGLDELRSVLADLAACVDKRPERPFRMCVDRAFVLQGLGTVITGTIASGAVTAGDELAWLPSGKSLRVRSVQSHGSDVESAYRGQRAALNVSGAHHTEIVRGHVVAAPGYLRPSRRMTVRLDVLAESPWPLRHRARVRLHLGTQDVIAVVRLLSGTTVEPGGRALAQLICVEPIGAVARQPFVIRSVSPVRTLGGGVVLQPDAPFLRRGDEAMRVWLDGLTDEDETRRAAAALFFNRGRPFDEIDLCRDADIASERAGPVLASLTDDGVAIAVGTRGAVLHEASYDFWRARILDELQRLHDDAPLNGTVPRERLAARLPALHEDLLTGVLERMAERGDVAVEGKRLASASFKPRLSKTQRSACAQMIDAYESSGFRPPARDETLQAAGLKEKEIRPLIDLCVEQGALVRIDGALLLHEKWERELRELVAQHLRTVGEMTVSEIKDVLGTSRKYAVPFCEYLDRIGVTRRNGDRRTLAGG